MRVPPGRGRAASIKGSISGTLEGWAEAEQTDVTPCPGRACSHDRRAWWGPVLCQGAPGGPCPPQAHSVVGTQMSNNTRQQRPRGRASRPAGAGRAGAHSGKGRRRPRSAGLRLRAREGSLSRPEQRRAAGLGVCSGFTGEPLEVCRGGGRRNQYAPRVPPCPALPAQRPWPLVRSPSSPAFQSTLLGQLGGSGSCSLPLARGGGRGGLCTKSEAGLFGGR